MQRAEDSRTGNSARRPDSGVSADWQGKVGEERGGRKGYEEEEKKRYKEEGFHFLSPGG